MSDLRFDGKTAIVTGGGRGLGRAYALLLAQRGACVVVNDPGSDLDGGGNDAGPARAVVAEIERAGGQAVANFASVATEHGARAMVEQAVDTFGGIHLLVNNAGNFTDARPFLETSTESFESLWRVHLLGTVNVIRAAWPAMIAQRFGRIVNIGSHGGYYGHKGKFEYATVKAGVHGLTLSLAMEGGEHGVHANVVAPGAATRPVLSWAPPGQFDGDGFTAELVAPTAIWLLHESCDVNGAALSAIAGNTSRIVVCETTGYQDRSPTPEKLADHIDDIVSTGTPPGSNLVFPTGAIARGAELMARFDRLEGMS